MWEEGWTDELANKPTQDGTFKKLYHIDNLPQDAVWRDKIGLCTRSLGQAAGSRKLYVNIDSVPPGAYSTRFHSHSQQEEFFLVLEGCGTLHLNDDCIPVKAGDFFAKPAGEGIAHTFYNSGENRWFCWMWELWKRKIPVYIQGIIC